MWISGLYVITNPLFLQMKSVHLALAMASGLLNVPAFYSLLFIYVITFMCEAST